MGSVIRKGKEIEKLSISDIWDTDPYYQIQEKINEIIEVVNESNVVERID